MVNYADHHEDPAAPVDQGLPGDVGGLDPDQDQAEAPPAGQPHQGERCHIATTANQSPDNQDIRDDQLCGPECTPAVCSLLEQSSLLSLMSTLTLPCTLPYPTYYSNSRETR